MPNRRRLIGSVVAFEGHPETISTQLRLLPTSPQILILPTIQCYLPKNHLTDDFDARTFIKRTHEAVTIRNQAAHDFLQGSTSNNKRLVFMNGSTIGTHASCIRAIMKYETNGDYQRAKAIFNRLIKDGVTGLDKPSVDWKERYPYHYYGEQSEDEYEDPITRAMRAADALDRQTASLQPINELDLTITTRSRSNSLPLYGYADNFGDAAPFFVFGARDQENDDDSVTRGNVTVPRTPKFSVTHYEKPSERYYPGFANLQPPSPKSLAPRSPSCIGESYTSMRLPTPFAADVFTPRSDVFSIRSTDNVVFGEASLLDMRLSGRKASLTRVKSLDRIYPATPKYRDLCLPPDKTEMERRPSKEPRRHSCMVVSSSKSSLRRLSYIDGPRTIVVRTCRPTVKVSPVPPEKKRKLARPSYVDRGTDAEEVPEPIAPFKPVLPFSEDLVVYFRDEMTETLLRLVVQSFKAGNCPLIASPPASELGDFDEPITPESGSIDESEYERQLHDQAFMPHAGSAEEYDPFSYVHPAWSPSKSHRRVPTVKVERPPTPAQTPPPVPSLAGDKIHEFEVVGQKAPVAIQNSLRSVLKVYFPPETQGYRQFLFPLLPELEGLWRPIFREADPDGDFENDRRMDQILAIGAQRGVRKGYASAITGQLEKLGTKASGMSRSGRLDFRYLVANAMQAFTAQPLANQTHDNPFTNPYLLATLIIPHLETYLALHSEVKFLLLEYPPEHLPTMLALQNLIGVDLMKVAQIIDSKSKEALQFTHLRGTHLNSSSEQPSSRYGPSPRHSRDVTVSKANFLLTCTATESEIATFVSTISKILYRISPFYTPQEAPKKSSPKQLKLSPLQGTFSAFPRVPSGPKSPPMSPALTARFGIGPPSSRTPSIAETVKTSISVRSRLSRGKAKKKQLPIDTQSVLTMDLSDSEWDMEDRRIMPTLVRKAGPPNGNNRKALRFLGLA